eukprot:tig00021038_g17494.t1
MHLSGSAGPSREAASRLLAARQESDETPKKRKSSRAASAAHAPIPGAGTLVMMSCMTGVTEAGSTAKQPRYEKGRGAGIGEGLGVPEGPGKGLGKVVELGVIDGIGMGSQNPPEILLGKVTVKGLGS